MEIENEVMAKIKEIYDLGEIKDRPIIHLLKVSLQLVGSIQGLSLTERGFGGFGSTGK